MLSALLWIFGKRRDDDEEAPPLVLRNDDGWEPYQFQERREVRAIWGGSGHPGPEREPFSFDVPAQLLGHLKGGKHVE